MRFISWKRVKSWKCLTCGECCKWFDVPLKLKEYARIIKIFNSEVFNFNKNPIKFFLKRRENGRCIFQYNSYGKWICGIQQIKPIVCKLFPFLISKSGNKKALYIYKGKPYNVYLERKCKGIKLGKPSKEFFYKQIPVAIEERLNPEKSQHLITSQLFRYPPILTSGCDTSAERSPTR